ncbi:hypothetical protein [Shewanella sp. T24-MNA-CIBAN-0130]|uniref:hypothetical protein n=1 Tax=Shewanella sp. T24-MNA-CIBAN-0130 TaxID=3140470 RepID=UPI0033208B4E
MINRINLKLDVTLKILSLSFTACLFIGTAVTWSYLEKIGFSNEITSVISSPQVLLTIALYSVSVSFSLIFMMLLVPAIVEFCLRNDFVKWKSNSPRSQFSFVFIIVFIFPLISFLFYMWKMFSIDYYWLYFLSLCLLITALFYIKHGGPELDNIKNTLKTIGIVYVALGLAYSLLVFSLSVFLQVTIYIEENKAFQFIILSIVIILYSAAAAGAVVSKSSKIISYMPVAFIAIWILLYVFADKASTNIMSALGVGSYSSSYAVEAKNLVAINKSAYKIDVSADSKVFILRDVWVVASLSNKLIFSSAKDSSDSYSIPRNAILSEIKVMPIKKDQ